MPSGRGPAWNNSLFEDNAEFGLGMRLGIDAQDRYARFLLERARARVGDGTRRRDPRRTHRTPNRRSSSSGGSLPSSASGSRRSTASTPSRPRDWRRSRATSCATACGSSAATAGPTTSASVASTTCLSSGRNVNVLVLDTEVYSNTGGQASKATQRGAVAKFAAAGQEHRRRRTSARSPRAYGNVYVAQVAMGGNELQTTKALLEADAWPGPSLVIAYSTCIAHGIDMSKSMTHQKDAVKSGYWPLYRFQPSEVEDGQPFKLDSKAPSIPVRDFVATEARYAILERTDPARARELSRLLQSDIDERWRYYEQLATMHRTVPARGPCGRGCRARDRERRGLPLRERGTGMIDLSTRYLGLDLRTPIVASASPLNGDLASARLVEDAGASAIVMPSLFEEEILHEEIELNRALEAGSEPLRRSARLLPRRRRLRDGQ